jgi:cell fate regulator YaaT (PSP1 superfamily)
MRYILTIRYGVLKNTSDFLSTIDSLKKGDQVIVRSNRGIEFGEVIAKLKEVPDNSFAEDLGEVLRKATSDDEEKQRKINDEMIPVEFKFCQKKIKEHKLLMKLASVEHLYGTKKIIFYYLANGRVDFRELVKDLAKEYQARIEMKQIGVRDEARLLADYEHCGRELCCRSFLKNLEPVTMKMAKNQKATLDPSKISGRCGRLMCCLRYEDKVYEDLKQNMPKRGSLVKTAKGIGEVINHDVLQQQVTIEIDNRSKICISVQDIIDKVRDPIKQKEKTCDQLCEKDCDVE